MRQLALVLHTLMLAAAAACHSPARTTVTPENLIGTYRFERSGTNLGRDWSVRSTLTLDSSTRYELENTIRNGDETNDEIELGVYYIDRHSVKLRSEKSETTELLVRGDSLVAKIDWPGRWFARFVGGSPVYVKQK